MEVEESLELVEEKNVTMRIRLMEMVVRVSAR